MVYACLLVTRGVFLQHVVNLVGLWGTMMKEKMGFN